MITLWTGNKQYINDGPIRTAAHTEILLKTHYFVSHCIILKTSKYFPTHCQCQSDTSLMWAGDETRVTQCLHLFATYTRQM